MNRLTEIILEFKEGNYNSFNEFYNQTSKLVYYMISCYEKRKVTNPYDSTWDDIWDTEILLKAYCNLLF